MVFRREKRWVEWWLDFFLRGKSFLEWKVKEKDRWHISEKNIFLRIISRIFNFKLFRKIIYIYIYISVSGLKVDDLKIRFFFSSPPPPATFQFSIRRSFLVRNDPVNRELMQEVLVCVAKLINFPGRLYICFLKIPGKIIFSFPLFWNSAFLLLTFIRRGAGKKGKGEGRKLKKKRKRNNLRNNALLKCTSIKIKQLPLRGLIIPLSSSAI